MKLSLALIFIATSLPAQTSLYEIKPEPGANLTLEVYKTGLMSGKKHILVFERYTGSLNYNAANPIWLGFDCVSVIHPDIDVSSISLGNLDGVFTAHRELFEPLGLMFMRRSGWVCESPDGQRFLSHWIAKRNLDRSPWAEVRQFDTFEAAGEWMLLSAANIAILKSGEGFKEITRFETPAPSMSR